MTLQMCHLQNAICKSVSSSRKVASLLQQLKHYIILVNQDRKGYKMSCKVYVQVTTVQAKPVQIFYDQCCHFRYGIIHRIYSISKVEEQLYQFPVATITNYQNLLTYNHTYLFLQFQGQKSKISFTRLKSKYWSFGQSQSAGRTILLLEALRKKSVGLFQHLELYSLHSLAHGPFLHFQTQQHSTVSL